MQSPTAIAGTNTYPSVSVYNQTPGSTIFNKAPLSNSVVSNYYGPSPVAASQTSGTGYVQLMNSSWQANSRAFYNSPAGTSSDSSNEDDQASPIAQENASNPFNAPPVPEVVQGATEQNDENPIQQPSKVATEADQKSTEQLNTSALDPKEPTITDAPAVTDDGVSPTTQAFKQDPDALPA